MSDILLQKLKALVAAIIAFGATWASAKYPAIAQILTPELQATIVGLVTGLAVHQTPNQTATA